MDIIHEGFVVEVIYMFISCHPFGLNEGRPITTGAGTKNWMLSSVLLRIAKNKNERNLDVEKAESPNQDFCLWTNRSVNIGTAKPLERMDWLVFRWHQRFAEEQIYTHVESREDTSKFWHRDHNVIQRTWLKCISQFGI